MFRRLLAVCAVAVPAFLNAQEKFPVAPATLSLTLSTTRSEPGKPGKSGTTVYSAATHRVRIGNADILEAMRAAGKITEVRGWSLVSVWGSWTEGGNGYHFYARRVRDGRVERVPVPTALLTLEADESGAKAMAYRYVSAGSMENVTTGTEKFELLNRLSFDIGPYEGTASGILSGGGEYARTGASNTTRYRPGAAGASLQGAFVDQSTTLVGLVNGSISIGSSNFLYLETPVSSGGSTGPISGGVDTSIAVSVN